MIQQGDKIDWDRAAKATAPKAGGIDWDAAAKATAPDPSITDKVRAFAASVGGAAYQSTGQAMEFVGRNTGLEGLESSGQALTQRGEANLQAAETVNPGGFGNEVGQIVGSGLPMAVAGAATGGASLLAGAGLRGAAAMGSAAVSLFGGAQNAQQGRDEAIAFGRPDQANKSEVLSFLIGLSEGLPVWGFVGKAVKAGGMNPDKIAGLLIKAVVENAAQEGGQQLLENPKAKMLYDERRAFTEGVVQAMGRGAIGGGIFGGAGVAGGKALEALSGGTGAPAEGNEPKDGSVQPGASQEAAAEPVKREALESVSPETETGLKAFSEQAGAKLRAVKPSTPEDTFLSEFGEQRGTRVTFVESEDGKPMRLPAMYRDGEVLLDANATPGASRRAVLYHELLHGLKDRQGESWDTLYQSIQEIDPAGLQKAEQEYADQFAQATGKPLPDILKPEEGLSRRAETLGAWLDAAINEPERLAKALDKSRTFRERLRDTVARILEAVGVRFDSVQQQRLKELVRDLGKPPTGNAQQSLELAHKFAQAINSMAGIELVPRTESPQPQRATKSAEVKGTATASTEAGQAAATTQGEMLGAIDQAFADMDAVEAANEAAAIVKLPKRKEAEAVADPQAEKPKKKLKGKKKPEQGEFADLDPTAGRRLTTPEGAKDVEAARQRMRDIINAKYADPAKRADDIAAARDAIAEAEVKAHTEAKKRLKAKSEAPKPAAPKSAPEPKHKVGDRVFIKMPGLRGDRRVLATVKRELPDGRIEVKLQEGGYQTVAQGEAESALGTDARFAVAPKTDTPEFKRWFGDSKVVDESGKPRAVYHGARGARQGFTSFAREFHGTQTDEGYLGVGFYFDGSPEGAGTYAGEHGSVKAVYLSLQSPLELWQRNDPKAAHRAQDSALHIRNWLGLASDATPQQVRDAAESRGYDGVIFHFAKASTIRSGKLEYGDDAEYVAFHPEQIKSAIGNSGAFDPKNPDIRFAVSEHVGQRGPLEKPGVNLSPLDKAERLFRDRLVAPRKIGKVRGVDTRWADLIERMPARVADKLKRLDARAVKPIRAALDKFGIELWEAGRYAYALHAPDANALAAKRNPKKYGKESNPGSGMSNSESAEIIAGVNADAKRREGFKQIAALLREASKDKLATLVESGVLSEEQAAKWREDLGPNYISLKDSAVLPDIDRLHFGVGDNKAVSKKRLGRMSRASYADIIPQTLKLAGDAIVAGETNRAAAEIQIWAKELNDPLIAEIIAVDRADENDEIQQVSPARAPAVRNGETLFTHNIKGVKSYIIIRNADLARALESLKPESIGDVMRAANKVVGFLRHTRTNWTLEFPITNAQSDVGGALITIQREQGKKLGRRVLKGLHDAFLTAWNAEHETGRKTKLDKRWAEGREDGMAPMYAEERDFRSMLRKLEKGLDPSKPVAAFRDVFEWINATNGAMELMTRFSIYNVMRDELAARGVKEVDARREAARIAQETTTPFMRKGELSTGLGMLYLFFNARVQGTAILVNSLKSSRVRNALGAMLGVVFLSAIVNRAMLGKDEDGEDEWDKIDKREKYSNFLMAVPGTKRVVKVRAPRMFQPFHTAAISMADMLFGDGKATDAAKDILTAAIDGFQPLDSSASLTAAITPTVLQPITQPALNEGPFGRKVNPDYPNDKRPPSEQAFRGESEWAKDVAAFVNDLTGGDSVKAGRVSVKPGTIRNFFDFAFGGTGQLGSRIWNLGEKASGEQDIEPNDIPLWRKLVAGQNPRYESSRFYDIVDQVESLTSTVKAYQKAGQADKAKDEILANPGLWKLRLRATAVSKRIKELRDTAAALPKGSPRREQVEDQIEKIMEAFNDAARKAQ